jgi:hypothetical protein
MVRGQRDRFEAKFGALLTAARALPTRLAEAVDASYSDGVPGDQFPEATAARQMLRVLPLYHAAIAALANSETALRALALMRPLMEAWAQLYFIMGDEDEAGRPCRAIRLEAGWAAHTVSVARSGGQETREELEKALRRQKDIEGIQGEWGCKGSRRDYGDCDQTIREMDLRLDIDWLLGAWRSSSQMVHAAAWDWILQDQGDGSSVEVDPSPSHRAARLNHLVVLLTV